MPVYPKSRVLRLPEVKLRLGLGRDTIYRGGREGWLPKRIKVGKRASGWFEHEIEAYLKEHADQRGDQPPDQIGDQRTGVETKTPVRS